MRLRTILAALAALAVLLISLAVCLFLLLAVVGPHGMITLPEWLTAIAGLAACALPLALAYWTWRRLTSLRGR
jgi:hypothetical protein